MKNDIDYIHSNENENEISTHNLIINKIYLISNFIAFICIVVLSTYFLNGIFIYFDKDYVEEEVVYSGKINEKVKIDDRTIIFDDFFHCKDNSLYVTYHYYDLKHLNTGWSLSDVGTMYDDLENEYFNWRSGERGSVFLVRGFKKIDDFSKNAKKIIFEYDKYNRYYKVEIDLMGGRNE